jgi:hypothetical protein
MPRRMGPRSAAARHRLSGGRIQHRCQRRVHARQVGDRHPDRLPQAHYACSVHAWRIVRQRQVVHPRRQRQQQPPAGENCTAGGSGDTQTCTLSSGLAARKGGSRSSTGHSGATCAASGVITARGDLTEAARRHAMHPRCVCRARPAAPAPPALPALMRAACTDATASHRRVAQIDFSLFCASFSPSPSTVGGCASVGRRQSSERHANRRHLHLS